MKFTPSELTTVEATLGVPFSSIGYRPAVQVLIRNAAKEIVIIQKHSYTPTQWSFPGGGIDDGEDVLTAALREVEEELGVTEIDIIGESKHKDQFDWPSYAIIKHYKERSEKFRGQSKHIVFATMHKEQPIRLQEEELTNYKWVSSRDLLDHMNFEGQRNLYSRVIKEFESIDA